MSLSTIKIETNCVFHDNLVEISQSVLYRFTDQNTHHDHAKQLKHRRVIWHDYINRGPTRCAIFNTDFSLTTWTSWRPGFMIRAMTLSYLLLILWCCNVQQHPTYGVYISQLFRYARVCSIYEISLINVNKLLTIKLLKHAGLYPNWTCFCSEYFYGWYSEMVSGFQIFVSQLYSIIISPHFTPVCLHITFDWLITTFFHCPRVYYWNITVSRLQTVWQISWHGSVFYFLEHSICMIGHTDFCIMLLPL